MKRRSNMSHVLTVEDEKYWEKWIEARDPQAADHLLRIYMPLVHYHVHRLLMNLPKNVDKEEMKSYGMMGLYDALEKFDPTRELKFDTYASFRIRGAIIDGLRKEDWIPRTLRDKIKKLEATIDTLEQELMREVTPEEVSIRLNISVDEVESLMNDSLMVHVLSMDDTSKGTENKEELKYLIRDDKKLTPEEEVLKQEKIEQLASVIEKLNEKEQYVITLFYFEELTLTEIGELLGLSTSRISQIHSKAISRLRNYLM